MRDRPGPPGGGTWQTILFLTALVTLAVLGAWPVTWQSHVELADTEKELRSIALLKADQIAAWRRDQLEDAALLVANPCLLALVDSFESERSPSATEELRAFISRLAKEHDYSDVLLLDAAGTIVISASGSQAPHAELPAALAPALRDRSLAFVDVHSDSAALGEHTTVIAPLPPSPTRQLVALAMVSDVDRFLSPFLSYEASTSTTLETFLVRRDPDELVFLSNLRFAEDPARRPAFPTTRLEIVGVQAIGEPGTMKRGIDYRAQDTFAVAAPVAGSPWFVIAKVDAAEALDDWHTQRAFYASILVGALGTLVGLWLLLRQHQRKLHYRELFEKAPDAIFIQTERRFASLNEACVRIFGASSPSELIGQSVLSRFHPDHHARITARIDALNQARQAVGVMEEDILTLSGKVVPVEVSAVPFRHSGKNGALVFMRNISARRAAESERDRLLVALEELAEAIFITNQDGNIVFVNDAFENVTGYSRAEALGMNPRLLQSGAQGRYFYDRLWKTLREGHVWRGRIINRRKNGQLYTAEMAIAPVRSSPDEPAVYVAVQRDVTADLKLQAQYQQAQKMESVGRLAGGIAHDFNNVLGVIMGHAELALMSIGADNPLRGDLQEIFEAASRAAAITRQLLAFARRQTIAPAVLDLNATIEGTLKMLRRLIGEDIDLLWKPSSDLWPVKMDPAQIDQILANLCVNARDAIESNGKVTIETANVTFDDAYCADHAGFTPGDFVMMAVSDDGIGMDKATLALIFEPFFTTKDRERGTGLGLATVYGIVKQNGGFINVYSEPGEGTTFRVYLARETAGTAAVRAAAAVALERGRGETILVVEDEAAVLRFAERALDSLGYQVLVAEEPLAALDVAHAHAGSIDLLLTDVVMPEINGRDLAARIGALRPGIKTLFMSGYTPNVIAHRGVLEDGIRYLPKPFSIAQLANKVREALDHGP